MDNEMREEIAAIAMKNGTLDTSTAYRIADGVLAWIAEPAFEGELTDEEQAMIDAAWEKHKAAAPCTIPPEGWYCTREPGHEGPCAAHPLASPPSVHDMREALELAANRMDVMALDAEMGSRKWYEYHEWAQAARAALASSPMDAVKAAVEAEREACAVLADEQFSDRGWSAHYKRAGESIAFAIRARAGGAK